MDGIPEEVVDTKKKKVPLSQQPGALPPVLWSPDRPRPVSSLLYWGAYGSCRCANR